MWPMSSLYPGYETKTIPHCSSVLKKSSEGEEDGCSVVASKEVTLF